MVLCYVFHSYIVMDGKNKIALMQFVFKMILMLLFKVIILKSLLADCC